MQAKEEDESLIEKVEPNFLGIRGLYYSDNFLSKKEETELLLTIDKQEWNTKLTRRTQHYGYIYDYTSKGATEETTPIPDWCEFIIERLMKMNILTTRPDQLIINEYLPGQGIYPHVDNIESFEDGIVSISLASSIIMDLIHCKNPSNQKEILLQRRSVVCFHEEARYKWRHGIKSRKVDRGLQRGRRVSLTFRKMKFNKRTKMTSLH